MITPGSAAAGRFRNAVEAARDAWTKSGLLTISKVTRLREARDLALAADPVALGKLLVDMAGPIRQVRMADALSARMQQHQKLMELVCRAALKSEVLEANKAGAAIDFTRVQRRLESWIEHGHWTSVAGTTQDIGAARAADMAALCGNGMKAGEAITVRLTLVAPLAPALEHLRLAVEVPESVLESMEASQRAAKEGMAAQDAADAAAEAEAAKVAQAGAPDSTDTAAKGSTDGSPDFPDTVVGGPRAFADTAPAASLDHDLDAGDQPGESRSSAVPPRAKG